MSVHGHAWLSGNQTIVEVMAEEEERRNDGGGGGDQVGEKMTAVESQEENATTTEVAVGADWANLLPELLQLIAEKLNNICDYVRFRSICPSWRMAVGPRDHIQYPFLPWMIGINRTSSNIISYYNIADDCVYHLELPEEAQGKWIHGSNYGWLVVTSPPHIHPTTVSLLNPITKAQIQLPSWPDSLASCPSTNFILCSNPVSPPPPPRQPLLAAWNDGDDSTVILCQGDHNWTLFKAPAIINDCTYFDGRLHYVCLDGRLAVLDVATSSIRHLIEPQPPKVATDCPLEFSIDEFAGSLLIFPQYNELTNELINLVALTYKLDISGKEGWKWVAVNGSTFTSRLNPMDQTNNPDDQYHGLHSVDQTKAIKDGIRTKKYHHSLIMGNKLILVPSLD